MKILRLDLQAFGSLSGVSLALASEQPCLHLIYGPNEAGKSTALRALHGLFYGIPEPTHDAHRFRANELRVGALLCDARGRELYVVRRKGRKQTLAAADGTPLTGADVSWITAGVAEAEFSAMFALSYDTLEQGADELLGSAGELGQSLFSAGAGGAGAHAVLEALQRESDAIYRPRGRTQLLNEALAQFDLAKRAVHERAIRSETFGKQQQAIDEMAEEVSRLQLQRQTLTAERARLERARRVLPLFAKRAEYRRQRAELGDVPLLPESAADERRALERALRDANLRIEHVEAELRALECDVADLEVPPAWLEPANQLELAELRDRLAQYRRAQRTLPVRRHALTRARDELAAMLERLGLGTDLDARASFEDIERLRITRPLEVKLREQARRGEALLQHAADLARKCVAKRDEVAAQQARLSALRGAVKSPPKPARAEPADKQIALPLGAAAPSERRKRESDRPPPLAAESRDGRVALRLEQIDEFERAYAELERERRVLADKQRDEEHTLDRALREVEALAQAGEPPTEEQLAAARTARRESSARLRASLRDRSSDSTEAQLDELERRTEEADTLSDRLRREASRVAEYARLRAAHAESLRRLSRLAAASAQLERRSAELDERWSTACARAGIATRGPSAMRSFLSEERAEAARLEQLEREAALLERELAAERTAYDAWRTSWNQLTARVGCPSDAGIAEVDALLGGLHDVFAQLDAAKREAREIETLERECAAFERDVASLRAALLPEVEPAPPDALAELLLSRHAAAVSSVERRAELDGQRTARRAELAETEAQRAHAERELAALMRAGHASDLTALEAAELASARARLLDAALLQVQAELFAAADGFELHALEGELDGLDAGALQVQLQEIDDTLERCEAERERAVQTLEGRRAGLSLLRESQGAADAALDAGAQLEHVRALAHRYVRVRLAYGVLAREVERYRERHTGPILRGASRFFAQLTNDAWRGLEADFGDDGTPILVCVRNDGERVGVRGLSAGTRDQLYLSLRLASIQTLAAGRELLPLVMDDLLIHFDDDRARAALRALGAFASTAQVLLFTHHARLCELAREALPSEQLRIHRLSVQRPEPRASLD